MIEQLSRMETNLQELRGRMARLERGQGDLGVKIHFTGAMVTAALKEARLGNPEESSPLPGADLPVPPELEAACAADPKGELQRVVLDVYGREVVYRVRPGSNASRVWRGICGDVARNAMRRSDAHQADNRA
jgi:hypothetical protein